MGVFTHGLGDYDHGLRAKAAGVNVVVCPGHIGTCSRNAGEELPRGERGSIRAQLAQMSSVKSLPFASGTTSRDDSSPWLWPFTGAVRTLPHNEGCWLEVQRHSSLTPKQGNDGQNEERTCDSSARRVLFIFDRVTHYHKDLFLALDEELPRQGMELYLLSGQTPAMPAKGRTGLTEKVLPREEKYRFIEYRLGGLTLRRHKDVRQRIQEIKPHIVVIQSHVGNISYWSMLHAKRQSGFQLVAWQCGYEYNPSRLKDALLRRFLSSFDFHLAYHSNARQYALSHGVPERAIAVMHNTIDERKILLSPRDEAKRVIARSTRSAPTRR